MRGTRALLVCALLVLAGGFSAAGVSASGTATAIHAGESVSADSDGTITAEPGETVTVTVWADAAEVSGYQTKVTFDPSVVEVKSVSSAEDFDEPVSNVNNDAGWVAFNQIRSSETSDPILAEITFEVTGDAGDSADISFVGDDTKFSDGDGETFSPESHDGVELSVDSAEPSFSVKDVTISTSPSESGSTVTVSALVENTGDAPGEYDEQVYVDENATDTNLTVELEAGQERRVNLSYRFDSPGTYAVAVGDTPVGTVNVREGETTTSPPSTAAESADDTPASTSTGETVESMPGFGVGVAALAIVTLAGWIGRRHGRND